MTARTKYQVNMESAMDHFSGGICTVNASLGSWAYLSARLERYEVLPQEFFYWIVFEYGDDPGPVKLIRTNFVQELVNKPEFKEWKDTRKPRYETQWKRDLTKAVQAYERGYNIFPILERECEDFRPLFRVEAALDKQVFDPELIQQRKDVVNRWATQALDEVRGHPYMLPSVPKFNELVESKRLKVIL